MAAMVLKSGFIELVGAEDETVSVTDAMGEQVVLVVEKGVHFAAPASAKDQLIADGVAEDPPSEE